MLPHAEATKNPNKGITQPVGKKAEIAGKRQAKNRIKNEVRPHMKDIITQFRRDLTSINLLYLNMREDGWHRYESRLLPDMKRELKRLRDLLDAMIDRIEESEVEGKSSELREAVMTLTDDLEYVQRFQSRDTELFEEIEARERKLWVGLPSPRNIKEPTELAEEIKEFREREEALRALMSDTALLEIFDWIAQNEGGKNTDSKIENRTKANTKESWKQCIGRYLISQHEVVEEGGWGYILTDRGKKVRECRRELNQLSFVEENSGMDLGKDEVAWLFLSKLYDMDEGSYLSEWIWE